MSVSHYQLLAFLERHKGNCCHAAIEDLVNGRTQVSLLDEILEIDWMESDVSVPLLEDSLSERSYQYNFLEYASLVNVAYELYKLDWCRSRGCDSDDADEEFGFSGNIYVCKEEFQTAEFTMKDYMRELLNSEDFALWTELAEKGEIIEYNTQ